MNLRRIPSGLTLVILAFGLAPVGLAAQRSAELSAAGSTEANITRLTTNLLERSQFSHHPFDSALASAFLDRYLDSLDADRSLFLQTDIDDFAQYRQSLAEATRTRGDTGAARAIFDRFLMRLGERTSFVTHSLASDHFDFTGHDVYSFDREHAQRPRDLDAAHQVWRQQLRSEYLQEKLGDKSPQQIVSKLTRRHEQQLRTMKALKSDEVLDVYLEALAHVYDPHSDYLGHEQMESLSIAMNLRLFGIGATLESADGYCKVRELVPGGPADRGGLLQPGDRIVAVAQAGKEPVDIANMPLSRTVELIRGPKGSTVTLAILPAGAPEGSPTKSELIVRDQVKLEDQEATARIVDLPSQGGPAVRLGVIDLPSFYADPGGPERAEGRSATADVARLLAKLNAEHVRGVVLDLRRNGGGSLQEAITLTGLFIRTGPVVQTRDLAGVIEVGADTDSTVQYDGPLVLLTSRFSASASEILAGALQDYGRALIVGDSSTFGKGTVQSLVPLDRLMDRARLPHAYDPGALKVTTSKFYRPSGASTQLHGVASDIVLPSTSDVSDINESALKNALPWDTVGAASHDSLDRVTPYVSALRELSARRLAADKQFAYLEDDVARFKKVLATKTVSLNEADRRQDLAEAKARRKQREEDRQHTGDAMPMSYEITVRNASASGLPPAVALGTKVSSRASTVPPMTDAADGESRDSSANEDIILKEGLRILEDYIHVLPG